MFGHRLVLGINKCKGLLPFSRRFCMKLPRDTDPLSNKMLFINTWTSGVLMIAGDLIQQEIEYNKQIIETRYDWKRVGRMLIAGIALGPIHHYFYGYLIRIWPGRDLRSVCKKLLADQLIMSPLCIVTFFYGMSYMEGKNYRESTDELKKKFITVYADLPLQCSNCKRTTNGWY